MQKQPLITLFLMGEKGLASLEAVVRHSFTYLVGRVVVGTDKNVVNDFSEEITGLCRDHGISWQYRKAAAPVETPFALAVSWRWLIHLDQSQLIVIHDSLLPKYRGFIPLVNQLLNKEPEIGITALFASEEYDRGDIILQKKTTVTYPVKISDAIKAVSALYAEAVQEILEMLNRGETLQRIPQNEDCATYSLWRNQEDYAIDWTKDAAYLQRFVNAVGPPYQGAQTRMGDHTIVIKEVVPEPDVDIVNRDEGKIIFMKEGRPVVVCGKGLLRIRDAVFLETRESIFPMKKFRIRFR